MGLARLQAAFWPARSLFCFCHSWRQKNIVSRLPLCREPRPPALLLHDDWMFAIAKPPAQQAPQLPDAAEAAAAAAAAEEASGSAAEEEQPARARPAFRNAIPGGSRSAGERPTAGAEYLSSPRAVQQAQPLVAERCWAQQAPARLSASVETTPASQAVAAPSPACSSPSVAQAAALPAQAALQAPAPAPACVQLQQPLPRWEQVPSLRALQDAAFDIRRSPASPAVPAAAAASFQQFAPMQQSAQAPDTAAAPSPAEQLAQQRRQLQQAAQAGRSPGAAATIDEVLASLRGRRGTPGAAAASSPGGPSLAQQLALAPASGGDTDTGAAHSPPAS